MATTRRTHETLACVAHGRVLCGWGFTLAQLRTPDSRSLCPSPRQPSS